MKTSVCLRPDIQQKIAVFGDNIGELLNDAAGRFVFRILNDAPGNIVFQAVIRLPWKIHALCKAAAFQILYTAADRKILLFIGQNAVGTGFVEMTDDLAFIGGTDNVGAAVKIQSVRSILVNYFQNLVAPDSIERCVRQTIGHVSVGFQRQGRTIKNFVGRIIDIRLRIGGHEPSPEPLVMKGRERTNITLSQ